MAEGHSDSVDPSIFENIKSHLEGLKRTPDGAVLYSLIARALNRFSAAEGGIEQAFVTFLYSLLGRYAVDPTSHPVTRMKARLLQQRLVPYLPEHEPLPVSDIDPLEAVMENAPDTPDSAEKDVSAAATGHEGAEEPDVAAPEAHTSAPREPRDQTFVASARAEASRDDSEHVPGEESAHPAAPVIDTKDEKQKAKDTAAPVTPEAAKEPEASGVTFPARDTPPAVEVISDRGLPDGGPAKNGPQSPPKSGLVKKAGGGNGGTDRETERLEKLEEAFAQKMSDTVARNKEIEALMRQTLQTLEHTETAEGVDLVKQMLIGGLQELIHGHGRISDNLRGTDSYLKVIRSERKHLHDTLNRLRKHSLADELTGLPNRTAFMRQLEAELGRAKRYGFSLALAIIDLDNLKSINERHGRSAGDEVLRCYAGEILSLFRGYDLVSRYDDDEFTALFPNTQKEGALRALAKAQKRAAETCINHNGKNIPLPTFSSVLTLYAPGEKPAALLKRADQALAHAKQQGYNRVVVALPTG